MTLHDLQTGMIVTTRNEMEWTVFRNFACTMKYIKEKSTDGVLVSNINGAKWSPFSDYNENMTAKESGLFDIVKVEIPSHPCSLLTYNFQMRDRELFWEGNAVREVTMAEVEKTFGYRVKIVP